MLRVENIRTPARLLSLFVSFGDFGCPGGDNLLVKARARHILGVKFNAFNHSFNLSQHIASYFLQSTGTPSSVKQEIKGVLQDKVDL